MAEKLNIYQKLMKVRLAMQSQAMKKSGRNPHAKFDYFELGDFLPTAQRLFAENGLCPIMSFHSEIAALNIWDMDSEGVVISFTTPMSTAKLPACHEVQNLGAVQTYLRRYLYIAALEIVEHDAVDAIQVAPAEEPAPKKPKKELSELSQNVLSLAQELCFGSADVSDWAMHCHNKKFGQLDETTQQTMYEELRKKHGHYLAIQAAMDAEHGAMPDGLSEMEKIDRTVAYLKQKADSVPALQGKPLRASADMWHQWVMQLIKMGEHE